MTGTNPFKPTVGANPPQLSGREPLIEEFAESIDNRPGAPGRLTIFTGPRGIGKTVMLNAWPNKSKPTTNGWCSTTPPNQASSAGSPARRSKDSNPTGRPPKVPCQ